MERMDKGDLLHIGTAYVEVHTFKGKDYVTVRDFSTTTNALSKEILELAEENKKLKIENAKLKDRIITDENFEEKLDKENKNLKETIKDHQLYEKKLEHRIIEFEELLHGE